MKKYKFKTEASLKNFIKGLCETEYKVCEDNIVEIIRCEVDDAIYAVRELQYEIKYLHSEINYLYRSFYEHTSEGHLPPINGAGKLEKAIKTLGLDEDYDVRKPVLYAKNNEVEVDLSLLQKNES